MTSSDIYREREAGRRIKELLEANNRYQQEARDARARVRILTSLLEGRDQFIVAKSLWQEFVDQLKP